MLGVCVKCGVVITAPNNLIECQECELKSINKFLARKQKLDAVLKIASRLEEIRNGS